MEAPIAVLPPDVIDQIAAGEVIERPASVVKELVDNAIDAGARSIAVEVDSGGRALIRVVDDGCGMSPANALLALERHATSKLRGFDDLWSLSTLGFRGEALPAIASVSRFTLTTRRLDALAATRIVVEAGRLGPITEVGAPVGTTVEVEELLRNVPARLKFLKSDATEASHTTELVAKIAMAYPELHVKLRHNGRVALDAPPDRDVFSRAQALLGPRSAERLVAASGEESGVRVRCILGPPDQAQTTARCVQLFVGRRPVRDRGLLHALSVAYGELVPRGRYPVAIVLIDPPGGAVDVNVHPQKAEVRFSDPASVYAAVRHVIQAAVARAPWHDEFGHGSVALTAAPSVAPPPLPMDTPSLDARPSHATSGMAGTTPVTATAASHAYAAQLREAREAGRLRMGASGQLGFGSTARSWAYDVKQRVRQSRAAELSAGPVQSGLTFPGRELPHDHASPRRSMRAVGTVPPPPPLDSERVCSLRFLGQLDLTYLVCEADRELVLIDQHVAFERVELARLRRRVVEVADTERLVTTQPMLFPIALELRAELAALAAECVVELARVGFDVSPVDATTLAVATVPSEIRHAEPTQLLTDILDRWLAQGTSTSPDRIDCALAVIACGTAVRVGDRVTPSEAHALLAVLDGIDGASEPGVHPTPAVLRLTVAEIARRFGGRG